MRTRITLSSLAMILTAAACGSDRPSALQTMTADIERDLAQAMAERPRNQVVSAIERVPTGGPSGTQAGRREPVPQPRRTPRPAPPSVQPVTSTAVDIEVAPEARPEPEVLPPQEPAVATTQSPAPDDVSETVPVATRGPSAGSGETGEATRGRGTGRGGIGIGTVIGVIIRGGSAGVDNCERHDRRRRGGGRVAGPIGGMGDLGRIGGVIIPIAGGVATGRPTTPYPRY